MRLVFIMVSFIWLGWGCCAKQTALSLSNTDSTVSDTVIVTDTIYFTDPVAWNLLYECDSNGVIRAKEVDSWRAKFDSLKKVSPIVRTYTQTKYKAMFVSKKEYLPGVVKCEVKKVVHPITYVAFGFGILCLITAIYLKYGTRMRPKGDTI